MKKIAFSIGHSNKSFELFLSKLQENNIDTVVDVRTIPRSRFCPQYNQKQLTTALQEQNITYLFRGHNLGGKGENRDYNKTMDELVAMMEENKKVCVMCSEKNYKDCHRHSMLEPSFLERGVYVEHIEYN